MQTDIRLSPAVVLSQTKLTPTRIQEGINRINYWMVEYVHSSIDLYHIEPRCNPTEIYYKNNLKFWLLLLLLLPHEKSEKPQVICSAHVNQQSSRETCMWHQILLLTLSFLYKKALICNISLVSDLIRLSKFQE